MTVNRTTLLDLPLPVTGTESGTWGDITNNGLTEYMDIAIAGMSNLTSADFTAGALTIETTEGNSAGTSITATSAQYAGFRVSSLAANSTITVGNTGTSPARSYRLINADATYNLTFKATGQTGVTLLPGQSAVVAFNGTDYVIVGTVGAGTATDNAVARFDGTTGEILQNSAATIDDTGAATFVGSVNVSGTSASAADLKLYEDTDNGTNYVAFKSPASVASNVTWTLPSADGTNGQALTTNGSGTLAFSSVTTAPGGSNTQVQFNNSGAFGGSSLFTWDGAQIQVNGITVGRGAGSVSTNTAVGASALAANTTGALNVAVGNGALLNNTTAGWNTAVGDGALRTNDTGAKNTAVGRRALYSNTSGTDNVGVGTEDSGGGYGPLWSNTTGSFNTALGNGALGKNTTASNNTAVGYQSLYANTTGGPNDAFGFQALKANTTGNYNVSVGTFSLGVNTTGSSNSALGNYALQANTTGGSNTALGYNALYSNTTASNNTAVGYQAGYTNQTGAYNTFIGYQAGYTSNFNGNANNVCVGAQAGYSLTTGIRNTFIGGSNGSSGSSGYAITTGSSNVILGPYTGNQDGLDIRTASNYAVISDGDGNRLLSTANGYSLALDGGAVPQSGTGITFPATQSASSDANTLDDYEEGTWTPTQGAGITLVGSFSSTGTYTKIGNIVTLRGRLSGSTSLAITAASVLCGGLPFTPSGDPYAMGSMTNSAVDTSATVFVVSASRIDTAGTFSATPTLYFSVTYQI